MSATLVVSYTVFSFFLFYQRLHLKNFNGDSEIFGGILALFTIAAGIFGYGFIIYWGFTVDWWQAIILFAIGFGFQLIWFPIEALLRLRNLWMFFSLLGFIALPIAGYFMWSSLP